MIYWDYNANSPLWPEVDELLRRAFSSNHAGNSSSVHRAGREARARLDDARARVARIFRCEPKEVCFTGSGSEADSLALKGTFFARNDKSKHHLVSSEIEHPAILETLEQLRDIGAQVTLVKPNANGQVTSEAVSSALRKDTFLCSLMWANNETGVVQPIQEIARVCHDQNVLFHTDAVQAVGKVPVALDSSDMMSLSAHKFGGPSGIGALLTRRGIAVQAQTPGHQEGGRRGGTHNVPYIEALALALELSTQNQASSAARLGKLRDEFEQRVRSEIGDVKINGAAPRIPNTSNIQFDGADGEALLMVLDLEGICVSAGAACASGSLRPSHVLTAMGLSPSQAHNSLRFSFGPQTNGDEVDAVVEALRRSVPKARAAAKLGAA